MSESLVTENQLLVTPEEAARRLSVGRTTIYELMSSGWLNSVNIGRCRRVPVSSLSSFVSRLIGDVAVGKAAGFEGLSHRASIARTLMCGVICQGTHNSSTCHNTPL